MTACRYLHRDRAELLPLRTLMPLQDILWGTDAGRYATQSETGTPFATRGARASRQGPQHRGVGGKARVCEMAMSIYAFACSESATGTFQAVAPDNLTHGY